jgi:hypothetical protein
MSLLFFGSMAGAGTVGFTVGLFLFKVKSRWCRKHGIVKSCPVCVGRVVAHS